MVFKRNVAVGLLACLMFGLTACAYPGIELTPVASGTDSSGTTADSPQPARANTPTSTSLSAREEAVLAAGWRGELATVYEGIAPSVLTVTRTTRTGSSLGAGFFIDHDGHIVTNHHVIAGTGAIFVTNADGQTLTAVLVGAYPAADLAILKVTSTESLPPPLTLGDSTLSRVGDVVLAVGNPNGLMLSLSVGVLSGQGRVRAGQSGLTLRNMLQTDAAINSGNSGGPLLNQRGEVIGVVTAVSGEPGSTDRLGFAVPVNTLKAILPELLSAGTAQAAYLGVQSLDLVPETARALGLSYLSGVIITNVIDGSPAAQAGLLGTPSARRVLSGQIYDVIVAIGERPVRNQTDLLNLLDMRRPGDQVDVTIRRGDDLLVVPVILGARPD